MRGFTGMRDVDFMILDKLNNKSLSSCSLVNKYIHKLCKEEIFWLNKYIKLFGEESKKYKPETRNWMEQYLKVKADTSKIENAWSFFDRIHWKIHHPPDWVRYENNDDVESMKFQNEKIRNCYYMLNLGKTFTIIYLTEFHKRVKVTYKSDKSYTPEKVINLVYKFYQNPVIFPDLDKKLYFQGFADKDHEMYNDNWPHMSENEYLILMDR